jgi:hypothetical protein
MNPLGLRGLWLLTTVVAASFGLSACGDDESGHDGAPKGGNGANAGRGGSGAGAGQGEGGANAGAGAGEGGAAASAGDGGGGAPAEGTIIGVEGGVVESDDGLLTLTIPEGALTKDTPISITAIDSGEWVLEGPTLIGSYRLEPDGTEFAIPAPFVYRMADFVTSEAGDTIIPLVLATTLSEDTIEGLAEHSLTVDLDTNDATLGGSLSHFSVLGMYSFGPTDVINAPYFYLAMQPKPPARSEDGVDYNVGLRVLTRRAVDDDVGLTYDDESVGLTYSEGGDPYEISVFRGEGDQAGDDIVPIGSYACNGVGAATFAASLTTDLITLPMFSVAPGLQQGGSGSGTPGAVPAAVFIPPTSYFLELTSGVECVAPDSGPDVTDKAPYSGYVDFLSWMNDEGAIMASNITGAFYGGGADQAAFDDYVRAKRGLFGVRSDRLESGACRVIEIQDYAEDLPPPLATVTHVGAGDADTIAAVFPDLTAQDPIMGDWFEGARCYRGSVEAAVAPGAGGIDFHVPTGAAAAAIQLPGWNSATEQAFAFTRGVEGIEITWQADLIQADHVHVYLFSSGESGAMTAECFTEPDEQLLTIPQSLVDEIWIPSGEVPSTLDVFIYAARRTDAAYDGRTLEGFSGRVTVWTY